MPHDELTLKSIALAFIPIFVAVDAIGLLPVFIGLTQDFKRKDKSKILVQSLVTALCLAVGFIFLGKAIFRLLGITVGDFMIAGGAILFCIAIVDLMNFEKHRQVLDGTLGVVPLGTPLIVGPAVLTTSLIIIDQYGVWPTIISVFLNISFVGIIFLLSDVLIKKLGVSGARALSKVTSLLLAAIAVMMIRKGLVQVLALP